MILKLENVNSFYGESHVLFDVNLEVAQGDSVCVLGRNGVGKSTTMKSVAGQLNSKNKSSVTGSILFDGQELVGKAPHVIARKGVAYVPQGRHIFPNLTVKENLMIAAKKGVDGSQEWNLQRIYELFPRLKERETSWGKNLSGGEQQMLTIARGLMQNPKLLLLDEITEGLAPIIVNQIADILNKLRENNVTLLVAEQNVNFALAVSRICYIIEKGAVVYHGLSHEIPKEILEQYLGT